MKWTLNTVWYLFLSFLQDSGIEKPSRGYVKRLVSELCKAAGVTRESIGIFAGVRAALYFGGEWVSVSFDSINKLAEKGTDIIFIEKEGIAEVLTHWADKFGIAMVNTRGHLTEYGKELMKAAKKLGAHVIIMTDYDATGVKIASETPTDMPWIGANESMLEYFGLSRDSISIESESMQNKAYIRALVETGYHSDGRKDERFKDVDVDFLDEERIELDAILAKVGDKKFFEYIMETLKKLHPKRDYNRAIVISSEHLQTGHEASIDAIDSRVGEIVSEESDKIRKELSDVSGFISMVEKYTEIRERLKNKLRDNPYYEDFQNKLSDLIKSHPFFKPNA